MYVDGLHTAARPARLWTRRDASELSGLRSRSGAPSRAADGAQTQRVSRGARV